MISKIHSLIASKPSINIVSGGVGGSGEQIVQTLLAQFPKSETRVTTHAHVRREEQLEKIVAEASTNGGIIVHTLVDNQLRYTLIRLARQQDVIAIDLVGPLLSTLSTLIDQKPLGKPGLYRQLNQDYYDRIAAIEYTMAHDDGEKPEDWSAADIVLIGVSRAGKTPLSMYLAVLGWKVANVPVVWEISPPADLFQLDHNRVIGLIIEPGQLVLHRQKRQRKMGIMGRSSYVDPVSIYEEIEAARKMFLKNNFTMIDVTDKPIEITANQIIELIMRRFKVDPRQKKKSTMV